MRKILTTLYFLAGSATAFAQGRDVGQTSPITLPNPLKTQSITALLDEIATFLLTISVAIAGIMVIIGAFQILTSAGDVTKVEKGKKTILYTVIGLAVMLLFKVIIALIAELVGVRVNL